MDYNSPDKSISKTFSHLSLLQWLVICLFFIGSATVRADFFVIPIVGNSTSSIPITDVKELGTSSIDLDVTADVVEISPAGVNLGNFTVPEGKYLVITAISVFPSNPDTGTVELQLIQNSSARKYWKLSNSEPSHLTFGHGILIAPNYALKIKNYSSSASSIRVSIYGYLTD